MSCPDCAWEQVGVGDSKYVVAFDPLPIGHVIQGMRSQLLVLISGWRLVYGMAALCVSCSDILLVFAGYTRSNCLTITSLFFAISAVCHSFICLRHRREL